MPSCATINPNPGNAALYPEASLTVLQIVANRPAAGKTALAAALLSCLTAAGQRAAYYKPLSPNPDADPDTAFIAQLLASDPAAVPPSLPQPFNPATDALPLPDQQSAAIAAAIAQLDAAFAAVLVEWAAPVTVAASPALPGYPVLFLYAYTAGLTPAAQANEIAAAAQTLGSDLGGIILNSVTRYRQQETATEILAPLLAQDFPILGAIPESRRMLAPTIQQVADHLDGRWLQEPADPAATLDRFLIGGNIMDSAPGYFGRHAAQAVITRAARPDIQMASFLGDTRCLILTGGDAPTEYIQVEARKHAVPLLLVNSSTLDTAETLGRLFDQPPIPTPEKLTHFSTLLEQHLTALPDSLPL